ncbi:hypothetical protein [Rhodococcus opacus]|uniref:Uncharacterized protein n=1 Tax=Rhodococcus opacus (strain B4) TaxID=632772 RepID=C1B9A5_RHOOB|nr:hypothetical protein [Rhodococcus opacus]BAH52258.1 hypothetical protein ROP_40110 [Rhodococcus opacus B4]
MTDDQAPKKVSVDMPPALADALRYAAVVVVAGDDPDRPDKVRLKIFGGNGRSVCDLAAAQLLREAADDLERMHRERKG